VTRDAPSGSDISGFEFDEYGNLLSSSGSGIASPKTWIGGLSVNDDRARSGMFNMGHRNYSAGVLGRFMSRDPIGFRGSSLNLYAYPTDPVSHVDPNGLRSLDPTGFVLGAGDATGNLAIGVIFGFGLAVIAPKPIVLGVALLGAYFFAEQMVQNVHELCAGADENGSMNDFDWSYCSEKQQSERRHWAFQRCRS
jgi:RHS repeat-associated protein